MALGIFNGITSDNAQAPASPEFPRPLDIFGGVAPAFAYGLRRLDSDYTGYAIRVRRDADDTEVEVKFDGAGNVSLASPIVDGGTEQTGSVSGGTYTVETSELMTLGPYADGGTVRVVKWYDQSGNGRDAFQTVEANQPILINSGTLGDGIDFVPNDYLKANYNLTTSNDHTFHAVAKSDAVGGFAIVGDLDAYDDGSELLCTSSGKWSYRIGNTDLEPNATTTNLAYLLVSYDQGLSTGTEQQMRVNGAFAQQSCNETLAFGTANRIRIGSRLDVHNYLNGKIHEIMAWNSKLTTAQEDILEENTLAHFNLSSPYSSLCCDFDGTNDYFNLGAPSTGTGAHTLSMWINPTTIVNGDRIISNTNNTDWGLQFNAGNIEAWGFEGEWYELTSSPSAGEWTHLVIVFDGSGNQQVYKNGVAGSVVEAPYNLSNLGVGATLDLSYGQNFDGKVDEVAIWSDSALTSAQITTIYNGGNPADLTSLSPTGWWKMGEGNAISTTITDHGSGGNNGTLVNGPVFTFDSPSY
jgi:hypothetical protein